MVVGAVDGGCVVFVKIVVDAEADDKSVTLMGDEVVANLVVVVGMLGNVVVLLVIGRIVVVIT